MSGSRRTIQVIGNSLEGWASALFMLRAAPGLVDEIAVSGPSDTACSPSVTIASPRARAFLSDLGLSEEVLFREADACFLAGTRIAAPAPFMLAPAKYGAPANSVSFHHYWKRMNDAALGEGHDAYSFGAQLAALGRFIHPAADPRKIESSFDYGYGLDRARLTALLRADASRLGAREGEVDEPWLVLDCDGSTSDGEWTVWPDLPAFTLAHRDPSDAPGNLSATGISLCPGGLTLALHSRSTSQTVEVRLDGEQRAARQSAPWWGNVVALGEATCRLPGLHQPGLMLLGAQLGLLASLLPVPGAPTDTVSGEYNRRAARMMDHVADFEALYVTRLTRQSTTGILSPSLARKVEQFVSRGRVVTYDDELCSEQDWITSFLGLGLVPERVTPLALAAPVEAVHRNYEGLRQAILRAAERLPTQQVYLGHLLDTAGGTHAV